MKGLSRVDGKILESGASYRNIQLVSYLSWNFRLVFIFWTLSQIQLTISEALSSIDLPNNMMYFTKEQFIARLRLSISSLFKQLFHFTQILPVFLHPNIVQILIGCSVLDMLFQLDLSLLEVLFINIVKLRQKERYSLSVFFSSNWRLVFQIHAKAGSRGMFWYPDLRVVYLRVQTKFFLYSLCWRF